MLSLFSANGAQDNQSSAFDFSFKYDSNQGNMGGITAGVSGPLPLNISRTPVNTQTGATEGLPIQFVSEAMLEFQTVINRLQGERETLSNLLALENRNTRELQAQLKGLQLSIESFQIQHLSRGIFSISDRTQILGKYACDYPACAFHCKDLLSLEAHARGGYHYCFLMRDLESSSISAGNHSPIPAPDFLAGKVFPGSPLLSTTDSPTSLEIISLLDRSNHEEGQITTLALSPQTIQAKEASASLRALATLINGIRGDMKIQLVEEYLLASRKRFSRHESDWSLEHTLQAPVPSPESTIVETNAETPLKGVGFRIFTRNNNGTERALNPTSEYGSLGDNGSVHLTNGDKPETNKRRRTGKEAAKFKCEKCSKQFTRSYTLREHARTHTNHRPFRCRVCGKTFVRLKDRNRHDTLHSGEKKFVCKGGRPMFYEAWGCGRKFAREDALVAHFRNEAGWACLRPLLTDAKLRDWFLQFADAQDEGEGFQCTKAIDFVGRRFGIDLDLSTLKCEDSFLSKDDLEFHFQTTAGKKCIGPLLVELATLDARRCRRENQDVVNEEPLYK